MVRSAVVFLLFAALQMQGSDLYVWQRQHKTALVKETAAFYQQSSGKLYFLAGELTNDNKTVQVNPSPAVKFERAVPVVRIHIKHMKKAPAVLADEIVKLYLPWQKCKALQIDLDAPEAKLDYYRQLMNALRSKLPGTTLSATVLPCHIQHTQKFRLLAQACDYYVLQVHGLSKENGRWFIMDENIARTAIRRANALKLPYKAALPFYCHNLERDLLVQPDLYLAARLAGEAQSVIGFRMGIPGETETLDLATALDILKGRYAPQLDVFWQLQANGAWYLMVRNKGFFPQQISCKFNLPPDTVIVDMDTFGSGSLDRMQRTVTFMLPPSGTVKTCMWLRCSSKEKLNKVNAFNINFNPGKSIKP